MRVVALDFDGVIAESAREAYVVAARTYLALRRGSWLASSSLGAAAAAPDRHDFAADALFGAFCALMPLGNRAEDYGVTLVVLEARAEIGEQSAYDEWYAAQSPAFLRDFHRGFYVERERLMSQDPDAWRRLQPPYAPVIATLRRRAGTATLAIATAKDRRSTRALLVAYGIGDLFVDRLVLDKEAGTSKRAHLTSLEARLACGFGAITFVDDKLRHLEDVAALGVRCALAGWGYNGPPERAAAAARGFPVLTFDSLDGALFARNEPAER